MKEGHEIGQSRVTLQKTPIGRNFLKVRIEFVKTDYSKINDNQIP
jgi:hypothetical protein